MMFVIDKLWNIKVLVVIHHKKKKIIIRKYHGK